MELEEIAKALPQDMLVEIYRQYLEIRAPHITEVWLYLPDIIHERQLSVRLDGKNLPIKYDRAEPGPHAHSWYKVFPKDHAFSKECCPIVFPLGKDRCGDGWTQVCAQLLPVHSVRGFEMKPQLRDSKSHLAIRIDFRKPVTRDSYKTFEVCRGLVFLFFDLPKKYVTRRLDS